MNTPGSSRRQYVIAAAVGGGAGGLAGVLALLGTKAVPKVVAGMMRKMIQIMIAQMQEAGGDSAEM